MTSLSFSRSTILSDSETETIDDIESIRSNTIKQKQRQTTSTRKNHSHTIFFSYRSRLLPIVKFVK